MDWQPNQEALKQIIEVLNQSQSPDTAVHRYVTYVSFFFLILNTLKSTFKRVPLHLQKANLAFIQN